MIRPERPIFVGPPSEWGTSMANVWVVPIRLAEAKLPLSPSDLLALEIREKVLAIWDVVQSALAEHSGSPERVKEIIRTSPKISQSREELIGLLGEDYIPGAQPDSLHFNKDTALGVAKFSATGTVWFTTQLPPEKPESSEETLEMFFDGPLLNVSANLVVLGLGGGLGRPALSRNG